MNYYDVIAINQITGELEIVKRVAALKGFMISIDFSPDSRFAYTNPFQGNIAKMVIANDGSLSEQEDTQVGNNNAGGDIRILY